jgi:hypothetical protein
VHEVVGSGEAIAKQISFSTAIKMSEVFAINVTNFANFGSVDWQGASAITAATAVATGY